MEERKEERRGVHRKEERKRVKEGRVCKEEKREGGEEGCVIM